MESSLIREIDFFEPLEQQSTQLRTSNSELSNSCGFDYFTNCVDSNELTWDLNNRGSFPSLVCSPSDVVSFEQSLFSASAPDISPRFEKFYVKDISSPAIDDDEDDDVEPDEASERSITEVHEAKDHLDVCPTDISIESQDFEQRVLQLPFNVLPASKTPCLDATAYCAELRLGAERDPRQPDTIIITDFNAFMRHMKTFCPKSHPTHNEEARIKALRRWFEGIPNKKRRQQQFAMKMKPEKKPKILSCFKKVQKFIAKVYASNSQTFARDNSNSVNNNDSNNDNDSNSNSNSKGNPLHVSIFD